MAVTQTITSVEQSGGNHSIYNSADVADINDFHFTCFVVLIAILIYFAYKLIDNAITKTCMGCKRLKKCEKRLKKLEEKDG